MHAKNDNQTEDKVTYYRKKIPSIDEDYLTKACFSSPVSGTLTAEIIWI
jgi:hypothetical protein